MKKYKMEFTEEEHRFIEKQLDRLAADTMTAFNQMMMDGQFRAGGNKLFTDEENKKMQLSFMNIVEETVRQDNLLRSLRKKFEKDYE